MSVLLTILVGVVLYAWRDIRGRELRTDWKRTLRVAIVLVPLESLEVGAVERLGQRTKVLEQRLASEKERYVAGLRPFGFDLVATPANAVAAPPQAPDPDDWTALVRFNWDLARWTGEVDAASGIDADLYDARIYLAARNGDGVRTLSVEGTGQQGGRVGVVSIDLTPSMTDVTLFVAAHELGHILGASDKYGPGGDPLIPDGLGDPSQRPRYPQRGAEIMARHRALGPGESVIPESLDELRVGPATAREVKWVSGTP